MTSERAPHPERPAPIAQHGPGYDLVQTARPVNDPDRLAAALAIAARYARLAEHDYDAVELVTLRLMLTSAHHRRERKRAIRQVTADVGEAWREEQRERQRRGALPRVGGEELRRRRGYPHRKRGTAAGSGGCGGAKVVQRATP